MNHHSDPTANQAIGNLTREWKKMANLAAEIYKDPCSDWSEQQRRKFTGIYRRLLIDRGDPFVAYFW